MRGKDRYRIRPFVNPSGEAVHRVTGRTPEGRQVRENYKDFREAVARKQELELEALNVQQSVSLKTTRLTDDELAQAEGAFKKLHGTGHSLDYAVTWFLAHWRPPSSSPTVESAAQDFFKEKQAQNVRPRTLQDYRSRVGAAVKVLGTKRVEEIVTDDIRPLVYRDGVSALSKNGDRRALHTFFDWCVLNGHCPNNPVKRLARARTERKTPSVLSLPEVEALLAAARVYKNGVTLPYFALALFGGFRPSELSALEVVDLTGKAVTVDSCIAKLRQRRVVEDLDTALRWLLPYQGRMICPPNFRRCFDAVRRIAGFKGSHPQEGDGSRKDWVPDVLRHTALSFHFAKFKDEKRTAAWAGNSPDTLHRSYRALVTTEDAETYWNLSPDSATRKIVALAGA